MDSAKKDIFNRYLGMLMGLVVGDCLGSPIQFAEKDQHPYIEKMEPCPVFNLPPGYWTDDSSMAFCVMDSFVREKGYDLRDIADTFVKWYDNGFRSSTAYAFDIGRATSSAIHGIKQGRLKNGLESSQGNGSIMRLAPSYLIAMALGRPEVLDEISDLTHDSAAVRATVAKFARILDAHLNGVRATEKSPYGCREEVNNSGWCVSTLDAALWAFQTTDSFRDGMLAAVNLGGDADSIGAVYGQLAGAFYGYDAIPQEWVDAIHEVRLVRQWIDDFLAVLRR
ncbi:MAG: ADP-ribosylglycohydrolase family protein [Victivallales bacterium]|nr:ADP-ribosylglycohydrolase family protein [Victivallales bacterium]